MNEPGEPPLLPLAGRNLKGYPRGPQRALAVKSRKSNRLFQVNRLASDLVDCLGEFLASKNVINRSERYAKISEGQTSDNLQITIDLRQQNCQADQQQNKRTNRRPPSQVKVKKFNQIGREQQSAQRRKRNVGRLLSDLLSGRCAESRMCLMGKLLRAPTVLAALFSLSLATSLFILYTLSFHHCQTAPQLDTNTLGDSKLRARALLVSSQEQQEVEHDLSLSDKQASESEAVAGPSLARSTRAHHINSRHLVELNTSEKRRQLFKTECGTYEGRPEGSAWALTGIAYASPPVGLRRWQKPRPVWQDGDLCPAGRKSVPGPQRAPTTSNHCVQFSPFNNRISGSEDCLHLDIYTPASGNTTNERLPVMVYIHGGFLVFGSSNGPPDGAGAEQEREREQEEQQTDHVNWMRARPSGQLASELNVVLVAPNYRLQALGFMALRALAEDNGPDGSEGNYGLWDQLVALEWIRRNIGSFGGNPDNVLVFGPDAASALPLALVSQQLPARRPRARVERATSHGAADEEERAAINLSDTTATGGGSSGRSPASEPVPQQQQPPFRSVWLMNPTIYYELPYELANQHYARLGWSQSACARAGRARDLPPKASGPSGERSLIACLMNLTGEQIVREYLGRDRPSFRLDDENSLPIRSIFPEQFVTLDGELVQDSYPFARHNAAPAGQQNNKLEPPTATGLNFIVGSTAQAVEYWPCPRNLHAWSWLDFRHYVETSLNSFNQPQASGTFKLASELYGVPSERLESDSSSGSNYETNNNNKSSPGSSPVGLYLTMVSDIRQVCPSHELARSLSSSARVKSLERYVVEWRPSAQLSASLRMTTDDAADVGSGDCPNCAPAAATKRKRLSSGRPPPPPPQEAGQANLQHAFHYWDLLALFGFEFDAQLEPGEQDLEFQRHVRAMAKRVAWRGQLGRATSEPSLDRFVLFAHDKSVHKTESEQLFARDGEIEHKRSECKMWRESLKQSYAWIS